jgi:hypothetical protein
LLAESVARGRLSARGAEDFWYSLRDCGSRASMPMSGDIVFD